MAPMSAVLWGVRLVRLGRMSGICRWRGLLCALNCLGCALFDDAVNKIENRMTG